MVVLDGGGAVEGETVLWGAAAVGVSLEHAASGAANAKAVMTKRWRDLKFIATRYVARGSLRCGLGYNAEQR